MRYAGAVNSRIAVGVLLIAVLCPFSISTRARNPEVQNPSTKTLAPSWHQPPPDWAYAINPPSEGPSPAKTPETTPRHVPGSEAAFTPAQISDFFNPPDWHPTDHPAMPDVVSRGPPTFSPAVTATCQTGKAARRIPAWRDCPRLTSFNNWLTSRAGCATVPNPDTRRPAP